MDPKYLPKLYKSTILFLRCVKEIKLSVTINHKHIFHDCVTLSRPKTFLPPSCHILQLDYNLFESQMNPPNKVVSCQIR